MCRLRFFTTLLDIYDLDQLIHLMNFLLFCQNMQVGIKVDVSFSHLDISQVKSLFEENKSKLDTPHLRKHCKMV